MWRELEMTSESLEDKEGKSNTYKALNTKSVTSPNIDCAKYFDGIFPLKHVIRKYKLKIG